MIARKPSERQLQQTVKRAVVRGNLTLNMGTGAADQTRSDPEAFTALRAEYLRRMRSRYQRLALDALIPPSEHDEHPAMMLEEVFVAQHVRENPPPFELLNLPREVLRRLSEDGTLPDLPQDMDPDRLEEARRAYRDRPTVPVLSALGTANRGVVVLGDPGAGKSTLARYLMLALAVMELEPAKQEAVAATIPADLHGRLPLLIELRDYAAHVLRGQTFLDSIDDMYRAHNFGLPNADLEPLLREERSALVVFDGLDEIFDAGLRDNVSSQIEAFASRYPGTRTLVTSRKIGYDRARFDAAGFTTLVLQDLDPQQIKTFAAAWYARSHANDAHEGDRLKRRLLEAVDGSAAIAELAGNPMLLTILAVIARHRELPRDRRAVYECAVMVLVQRWDVNKYLRQNEPGTPHLDELDKLSMLRRIARCMQGGPAGLAGNHLSGKTLMKEFETYLIEERGLAKDQAVQTARTMLDQFRVRNFILSSFGAGLYGFVHRAFLEYLAADDINDRLTNLELEHEELFELYERHVYDPAWREVLLLLIGMIPEKLALEVIARLQTQDPYWRLRDRLPAPLLLALSAVNEIRSLKSLRALAPSTTKIITELLTVARRREERSDQTLAEAVRKSLSIPDSQPPWLDVATFEDWYSHWSGARRLTSSLGIAVDLHIRTLCTGADLHALATTSVNPLVRHAAVELLARLQPRDAETLLLLHDRATNDRNWTVRQQAVQTLTDGWPGDPATLTLLHDRAANDTDDIIRHGAVRALAEHWSHDPGILPLLHSLATNDRHWYVRQIAVQELSNGWPQDPETLALVSNRAVYDRSRYVRQVAAQALAEGWPQNPESAAVLRDIATDDRHWANRQVAMEALAGRWSTDPATLALIRSSAVADIDEGARGAAVRALAEVWSQDPGTRPLLHDRAVNDPNELVRQATIWVLVDGWPQDPDTLAVLHQALGDRHWRVRDTAARVLARWRPDSRETLALLLELATNDAHDIVRHSAVRALAESQPQYTDTLAPLLQLAADAHQSVRQAAVRVIAESNDPATLALLHHHATNDPYWGIRQDAVQALAQRWPQGPETLTLLHDRATNDVHWKVRQEAVRALAKEWPQDSGTRPVLQDRAVNDTDQNVREAATQLVSDGWPNDLDTRTLLHDRATNDVHGTVRQTAIRALTDGWPTDPGTLALLHRRATDDTNEMVLETVVRAFAESWPDAPDTLTLLHERAITDQYPRVRQEALLAIAAGWPSAPATLALLCDRATDDSGDVRQAAIRTLRDLAPGDPAIFSLLHDRATNDPSEHVRRTAVMEIADGWQLDPRTLSVLHDRAVNDTADIVRQLAMDSIADAGPRDTATLALLHDRAANDPSQEVRQTAVGAIADGWPKDPGTHALLDDRATNDPDEEVRRAARLELKRIASR